MVGNYEKSQEIIKNLEQLEKILELSKNKKFNRNHLKSRLFFSDLFLVFFNNS
jgi:hypothetical protein